MKKIGLAIGIIILLALTIYFFLSNREHPEEIIIDEPIACTMDALVCPDGSAVGRSGPSCTFQTCPDSGPIVGVLNQDQNGLKLIINSPDSMSQEVNYVLPLQIQVTDALGPILGKRVEVSGSFVEANIFKVDSLVELEGNAGNATVGSLKVGEVTNINGVRITLNEITQDSRCPVDVMCIQAGNIAVSVTLESDTDKETVEIASDKAPHAFDSYTVSISSIAPEAQSESQITPEDYSIEFKVEKN